MAAAALLADDGKRRFQRVEIFDLALGVGHGQNRHGNVEVKYTGPDGVTVDVSETGWVGTSGLGY